MTQRHLDKVFITGASGFIGSNVARLLADAGHEVVCLMRATSSRRLLEGVRALFVLGDVTDRESLAAAVKGASMVVHLAGCHRSVRAGDFYQVNTEGTRNLLDACARMACPPVVLVVSSLAASGPALSERPRIEADVPAPVSHYGRSKLAAESVAREFADAVPITVVRPPIVIGDGDRLSLPMFKSVARTGLTLVPGRVPYRYSLIHAADLVEAFVLAVERGSRLPPHDACDSATESQGLYFVADDQRPTGRELGTMLAEAVGRRAPRTVRIPMPIIWSAALATETVIRISRKARFLNVDKTREMAAGSWTCSAEKAAGELGFRPAAPLSERFRQTAAWYRRFGWL
jgi:nucleoside-diphosphate-sugar epimerase